MYVNIYVYMYITYMYVLQISERKAGGVYGGENKAPVSLTRAVTQMLHITGVVTNTDTM